MARRTRAAVFAIVVVVAAALAGAAKPQSDQLTIYAAASLTDVFPALDSSQRYSFGGSNALETQIRNGAPADIHTVYDLKRKPVKLVIAGAAVPVGGYTRTVLKKMGLTSVLSKVVSQETDVRAVTGKVALGQADAGFVYVTDARSVADRVTVIKIPAWAQPRVRYEIAIVSKSSKKAAAQAWIKNLLSKKGQAVLKRFGFLPLPPA